MEVVTNETSTVTLSIGHQFAKMIIASAVAFWAGKMTENAYDKFVESRVKQPVVETTEE